ncbi:MAG TPA: histidine phosphatase family protein [Acidimicrobiales bacterium]|nr:histidine phosphatase family protein [Acidimicrobiales bacterium]
MELLLIRHARPQRAESVTGPADPPLAALGHLQAEALAEWLAADPAGPVDAVYTSPLRRATETAEPLAAALGLDAVVEPALSEYDAEALAYVPIEELQAAGDPRWMEIPDDIEGFGARVVAGVDRLAAAHPSQRIALVCHGGVINVVVSTVLGLGYGMLFLPGYTSVSRVLVASSGQRTVASLNETAHLRVAGVAQTELR